MKQDTVDYIKERSERRGLNLIIRIDALLLLLLWPFVEVTHFYLFSGLSGGDMNNHEYLMKFLDVTGILEMQWVVLKVLSIKFIDEIYENRY